MLNGRRRLDQPRSVPVSSLALERSELSDILDKTLNFDTTKEQRGESETDALVNIATNPSTFAYVEPKLHSMRQSNIDDKDRLKVLCSYTIKVAKTVLQDSKKTGVRHTRLWRK